MGKGVIKSVKDAHLRHQHYLTTLQDLTIVSVSQNIIKSKQHQLQSVSMKKVAISAFDTKRWLLDGGTHSRSRTLQNENIIFFCVLKTQFSVRCVDIAERG